MRGNDGASLVLVSIIAIIIITGVVILKMTTNSLWASADKQYYQDQAYVEATSLGESIDKLISEGKIDLSTEQFNSIRRSDLIISVAEIDTTNHVYRLSITSHVGNSEYTYTATYKGSGTSYTRQY
ncbi:MAG: hypothetical protein IK142_01940 [Clostridiales bacterium]|nr:hypothetical protein [Clostridiales bacterium]